MSEFLEQLKDVIYENKLNVYSIAEQVNGETPQTIFLQPSNPNQNTYSLSKVYVVTALGLLQDKGLLSVNDRVLPYFIDDLPKDLQFDPRWNDTTIDMMLRHYCGLPANFLDVDMFGFQTFGQNFVEYVFRQPLLDHPSKQSIYTDAAFYLLACIAEKVAHSPLDTYLWKKLFSPLGCSEIAWSHCPNGHVLGGTGLYSRGEDIVKLGTLYLNGGTYNNKRILSQNWVDTVLQRGYELHQIAPHIYAKGGMFNQMLMIIPSSRRSVAWNAYDVKSFNNVINWVINNG